MALDLNFANGTTRQQTQWKQALNSLMNFPMQAVPLIIDVEFVDPADVTGKSHNDLAATTWTYDSPSSSTKVRNDAPGYGGQRKTLEALAASMGLPYNGDIHYNETAVHEFAHSLFADLPQEHRVQIAEMFGAKSDSLSELAPSGAAWEDRIIEGIAETFKEAFLPRRLRIFPNRTNRKISYSDFPRFRRLFREGIEQSTGEGTEVPAQDLNVYGQRIVTEKAGAQVWLPAPGEELFFEGTFFKGTTPGGLYTPIERWEPPDEAFDNTFYKWWVSQSATQTLLVPHGTHFAGSVDMPQDIEFFGPSLDFAEIHGAHFGEGGFAGVFTWDEIHANKELEDPFGPWEQPFGEKVMGVVSMHIWFTYWNPATEKWVCWDYRSGSIEGFEPVYKFGNPHPKFPGPTSEKTGCWIICKGDNRFGSTNEGDGWSIPIGTISLASNVPSIAPTIETCGGDMAQVRIFAKMTFKTSVSRQDSEEVIHSRLPSFTLQTPARPCKGEPIDVPQGIILPGDSRVGSHPSRRVVVGR
jgi:hypothetical protein